MDPHHRRTPLRFSGMTWLCIALRVGSLGVAVLQNLVSTLPFPAAQLQHAREAP